MTDEPSRRFVLTPRAADALIFAGLVLYGTFIGGFVIVAIHFIQKYW
jgi:hypothetical protein